MKSYVCLPFHAMFCLCGVVFPAASRGRDESYYEYVPDRRPWDLASEHCNQRSGALATVSTPAQIQELADFLKSLKINQTVWVGGKVLTRSTSRLTLPLYP